MKDKAEELYYILFGEVNFKSELLKEKILQEIEGFLQKIAADAWHEGVQHFQEGHVE